MAMEERVEELRTALREKLAQYDDVSGLLAAWDEDGSGTLSPTEFYHACLLLGLDVNGDEAGALFMSLDADGSRAIDYRELRTALQPPPQPRSLDALTKQIAGLLAADRTRVRDLFNAWDMNGDSLVDREEFYGGLNKLLGFSCTRAETDALFAHWDANGSGRVD